MAKTARPKLGRNLYWHKNSPHIQFDWQYKNQRHIGSTETDNPRKAAEYLEDYKAKLREEHRALLPGEVPVRKKQIPTLDVAADEYWLYSGGPERPQADTHLRQLQRAVRLVGPDLLVTQVTGDDIASAMTARRAILANGRAPKNSTVNESIIVKIRAVIWHACDSRMIPRPPIRWGQLAYTVPAPAPRRLSEALLEKLAAEPPHYWRDFIEFQRETGVRLCQMFFGLGDIDLDQHTVHIAARKGSKEYDAPFDPKFGAMLAARMGRAKAAGLDTVWFRELRRGRLKPLTYGGASSMWKYVTKRTGAKAQGVKGSHDMRRHAAMDLYAETRDLGLVKILLGHK